MAVRTAAQVLAGVSASLAQFTVDSATSAANAAGFVTEGSGTFSIGEQGSGGPGYNAQQLAAALQIAAITAGSAAVFSVTDLWGTGGITSSAPVTLGLGGTAANSTVAAANLAAASAATGIATANLGTQAVAGSGITVVNHGTISLSSNNAAGIVVGGAADASAGLTMGSTAATTVSSVNAVGSINLSSAAGATSALSVIDSAINSINVSAAALGALQNRFTSTVSNLQATSQNLTAARGQILQQAGTAMLAQANSLPQSVLALLK